MNKIIIGDAEFSISKFVEEYLEGSHLVRIDKDEEVGEFDEILEAMKNYNGDVFDITDDQGNVILRCKNAKISRLTRESLGSTINISNIRVSIDITPVEGKELITEFAPE